MPPACEPRRSYRSSSPISIVTGWSSGSSRARARRIGMSFSRRSCSRYCMNGGALRARRAGCLPLSRGCFPATAGSIRVRASCIASFAWQPGVPASPSVSAFIRCGTALPPISWSKRPIFGPARSTSCGRCPADAAVITAVGRGWRTSSAIAGRLGVPPMPAMSASTNSRSCRRSSSCRTWAFSPRARPVGALGGHVERCEACAQLRISYNSCGNRHCPKCQAAAAKEWLADRQAKLLPVRRRDPDHHRPHGTSPWAEGPRPQASRRPHWAHRRAPHLGIGAHPPSARPYHRPRRRHLTRWRALDCLPAQLSPLRRGAFAPLPSPVPRKADRRLPSRAAAVLRRPGRHRRAGRLQSLARRLAQDRRVVYVKRPFGGPDDVLAYLSRYTHRVAIANSRLVAFDGERVTFKWMDYRAKGDARYKLMTLDADEFIRRFLIHVLPDGFHRIRHNGLFANANRANNIALARRLLAV